MSAATMFSMGDVLTAHVGKGGALERFSMSGKVTRIITERYFDTIVIDTIEGAMYRAHLVLIFGKEFGTVQGSLEWGGQKGNFLFSDTIPQGVGAFVRRGASADEMRHGLHAAREPAPWTYTRDDSGGAAAATRPQ